MTAVFDILAEPSRRELIGALRLGERSVNELAEEVALSQPGVSKQLRLMLDAGFVNVRQDGQRRLYSLRPELFQEVNAWMSEYRHIWDLRFDKLARHIAENKKPQKD
ncbi:MAG: ArsR/SmtB family transcription factor [Candidatus Sericytochromatia bacterium]